MNFTKNSVAVAFACAIGSTTTLMPTTASAVLSDGSWALTIVPTPTFSTPYGRSAFQIGSDGSWNSSFSYGDIPDRSSLGMTDNGVVYSGRNSAIDGDGFAGIIELNVSGNNISVPGTSMTGFVDGAGNMSFDPTGRLGLFTVPTIIDLPFYIDDAEDCASDGGCTSNGNTAWEIFSTGSASLAFPSPSRPDQINGSALTNAGDLDGDSIDDFQGVLVSGGRLGSHWGSFFGISYYETWQVEILSGTVASGFNVDPVFGGIGGDIAQYTSAVPIPAAIYLFGSGLLGLIGVARRKKA